MCTQIEQFSDARARDGTVRAFGAELSPDIADPWESKSPGAEDALASLTAGTVAAGASLVAPGGGVLALVS
jgi:hypothetical protein